jgi:hypothetical protein
LEVRRKFGGNSQIRALFLKVLRIRQFPRKCAAKYAENPVLRDVKSENFLGEDPHCVILWYLENLYYVSKNFDMSEKFLDPYNGTPTEIFLATGGGEVVKNNFIRKIFLKFNNFYCEEIFPKIRKFPRFWRKLCFSKMEAVIASQFTPPSFKKNFSLICPLEMAQIQSFY